MEIEYDDECRSASFEDVTGDEFSVECGDNEVIVDCLTVHRESICGVLDRPRVEALVGLLTRWLETGQLRPEGDGA